MRNRTKISAIHKITLACLLFGTSLAHAEERYLANTTTGSMREGPGSQYKAMKTLQNDQSFEVLETLNGFVRIRTKEGTEGWLQERFTGTQAPELPTTITTIEQIETPKVKNTPKSPINPERLAATQFDASLDPQPKKETPEIPSPKESPEIKKLRADLNEITEKFNQIEISSEDAQQFKDENDQLKLELSELKKNLEQLKQTNLSLTNKQNIYWFVAGSAVFLLGLLIGKISFRRQRHSSLTL